MDAEHAAVATESPTITESSAAVVGPAITVGSFVSRPSPKRVAIVAMGASIGAYCQLASSRGGWFEVADEVWAINATAAVVKHHRAFVMDDVKHTIHKEAHEDKRATALGILRWLPNHPGPVYTSKAYPEWPALVEYPLRDVLQAVGGVEYMNTTVAYAVGMAMYLGVQELSLYGCDFTYPNIHAAESGRGCVEYLLGIACSRGMQLNLPDTTTLLDANVEDGRRLYGYLDPVYVRVADGQVTLSSTKPTVATATDEGTPP